MSFERLSIFFNAKVQTQELVHVSQDSTTQSPAQSKFETGSLSDAELANDD